MTVSRAWTETEDPWLHWPPAPSFERAACRDPDVDVGWFFPQRGDHRAVALARKVCAGCEHLFACREFGLSLPSTAVGIYGGLNQSERRRDRRARRQLVLEPELPDGDDGAIDELDQADTVTPPLEVDAATNGNGVHERPCVVCGAMLGPNRQKTCSSSCAAEHERRRRARNRASAKPAVSASNGSTSHANGDGSAWPRALDALVGAGAEVIELRLRLNGASWSLVRSND